MRNRLERSKKYGPTKGRSLSRGCGKMGTPARTPQLLTLFMQAIFVHAAVRHSGAGVEALVFPFKVNPFSLVLCSAGG